MTDRAVCVCFDGDRLLVVRRCKAGRTYTVLPGGGVEPGEAPAQAALRELAEETGFRGTLVAPLGAVQHEDRRAHYFLVSVAGDRGPVLGGPEVEAQTADNTHTPTWVDLSSFADEPLVPEAARQVVLAARRRSG